MTRYKYYGSKTVLEWDKTPVWRFDGESEIGLYIRRGQDPEISVMTQTRVRELTSMTAYTESEVPVWARSPWTSRVVDLAHQLPGASVEIAEEEDVINFPKHYTGHPSGIECIQITEHMSFLLGNVIKYCWRADLKNDAIEDLKKARFYLDREIAKREGEV